MTVYSTDSTSQADILEKALQAQYPGLKLDDVSGRPPDLRQKVTSEQAAHAVKGDVIVIGGDSLGSLGSSGFLEDFRASDMTNLYPGLVSTAKYDTPVKINAYGITINTNVIPLSKAPKDWKDLTDPQYKGLIAINDPRGSGPGYNVFEALDDRYGDSFMKDLAKQKIHFGSSNSQLQAGLARGDYGIDISSPADASVALTEGGAPVKLIGPTSGYVITGISEAVIKNAPHPAAARCFVDWSLSKAGQEAMANAGFVPARKDVPAKDPSISLGSVGVMTLRQHSENDADLSKELTKKWNQIFF